MAGIWAVLPGATATAIDTALTAAARTTQRTGDPRTTDQLRADTLTHTLLAHFGTPTSDSGVGAHGPGALGGNANGSSHTSADPIAATYPEGAGSPQAPSSPGRRVRTALGQPARPHRTRTYRAKRADHADRGGPGRAHRWGPPVGLAGGVRVDVKVSLATLLGTAPAARCDLDHREPFNPRGTGGSTSAANLAPLCERDHLIKTHARWTLTTDPNDPGSYRWTTPTGHTYTSRPPPPPGHEPPPDRNPEPPF